MEGIDEITAAAISDNKLEIRNTAEKGRSVYSKAYFAKGEVIFEEDALVSCQFCWNQQYGYLACDHCMRPLESITENISRLSQTHIVDIMFSDLDPTDKSQHTVCDNCGVKYCSISCQMNAWNKYHKNVCYKSSEPGEPFEQLKDRWKEFHYPPETASIMLLPRIVASIEQTDDQLTAYNTFMKFCHSTINDEETLIHRMLGDEYASVLTELWQLFSRAMDSRKIPINRTDITQSLLTKEGFMKLLAIMARNGQGIGTSVLAEWVRKVTDLKLQTEEKEKADELINEIYTKVEEVSGEYLNNEGSGLYVLHSCLNHSCLPNAETSFLYNNNKISVVATKDISPNQEICISYIEECLLRKKCKKRQDILKDFYLFVCTCEKCERESLEENTDDDDDDDEDSSMEDDE